MRKTLAASAIGAALVLGGPQVAAHAETTASPSTSTSTTTSTSTEVHRDYTGLWGLLGLAGLAGLLRKRPEQVVRPVETHRTTVETHRTTVQPADHRVETYRTTDNVTTHATTNRVDNLRNGDLNNDGRRDI